MRSRYRWESPGVVLQMLLRWGSFSWKGMLLLHMHQVRITEQAWDDPCRYSNISRMKQRIHIGHWFIAVLKGEWTQVANSLIGLQSHFHLGRIAHSCWHPLPPHLILLHHLPKSKSQIVDWVRITALQLLLKHVSLKEKPLWFFLK